MFGVSQTDVLRVTSGKRMGFAVDMHLICRECGHDFGGTYSSPEVSTEKKPSPFAVNDMIVLLFNRLGLGHTAMSEFSAVFGIPPMHLKTFQKKEVRIINKTVEATDTVLKQSAAVVREMHLGLNRDFTADDPVPITVSFDGSWHKRGHTSMYGVAAVIEVMTGLVVDYVTLSSYCHSCSLKHTSFGDDVAAFDEWYTKTIAASTTTAAQMRWRLSQRNVCGVVRCANAGLSTRDCWETETPRHTMRSCTPTLWAGCNHQQGGVPQPCPQADGHCIAETGQVCQAWRAWAGSTDQGEGAQNAALLPLRSESWCGRCR